MRKSINKQAFTLNLQEKMKERGKPSYTRGKEMFQDRDNLLTTWLQWESYDYGRLE